MRVQSIDVPPEFDANDHGSMLHYVPRIQRSTKARKKRRASITTQEDERKLQGPFQSASCKWREVGAIDASCID